MNQFKDYEYKGGAVFCAVQTGNTMLTFQKENRDGTFCKKNIKVVDAPGIDFHIQKTQIKADGGASGLLRFLEKYSSWEDFSATYASIIYNAVFDYMKEVKL